MNVVISNASGLWGGLHTVTESLVRGLQEGGHRVLVLCRPGSVLEERMREIGACEPVLGGMDLNPFTMWRIGRELRRHRADVLLALKNKDVKLSVPAAAILGIPSVVRRADDQPFRNRPDIALLSGRLTTHHVANSHATRRTMLGSAPWLNPADVSVIYNGIDPEPFRTVTPAGLALPPGALVIGFVGRIEERKGIFELAEAWPRLAAALPAAHLVIAGRGPQEAEAKSRLADAQRVHWLGYRADVPAVMKALDLLVVPSHWEGFGFVLAEAMAAGVPVAASRASNLPEIFDEGVQGRFFAAHVERVRQCFTTHRMVDEYETLLLRVVRGERGFYV